MNKFTSTVLGVLVGACLVEGAAAALPGFFATQLATSPVASLSSNEQRKLQLVVADKNVATNVANATAFVAGIKDISATVNPPSMAALTCTNEFFALSGAASTGVVILNATSAGAFNVTPEVPSANQVNFTVCNDKNSTQDMSSQTFTGKYFP